VSSRDSVTNNLVALGSAAVIAVYVAGFARTREAAAHFARETAERRSRPPVREMAPAPASTPTPRETPRASPDTAVPPKAVAKPEKKSSPKPSPTDSATREPVKVAAAPVVAQQAVDSTDSHALTPPTPVDSTTAVADTVHAQLKVRDGVFFGWGTSRHGDIQAGIEIRNGRIISAFINECMTQYSCSWIAALPPQVIARQTPDVDNVAGATQSSDAFYYAVVEALKHAK
jgi:uncharacterized protein with FMN-binding domain